MPNDLTTSQASASASPETLVDRLFQKLALMYGKSWLDMWVGLPVDAVKAEWARTLTGVSAEQMRLAIESLLESGTRFPPNLTEFVSLCRQFRRAAPSPILLSDNGRRAPPRPETMQKIRDILKRQ